MIALALASWIGIAGATPATADAVDGRRLLLDCEKRFLKIETIRGTIKTRSTVFPFGQPSPVVEDAVSDVLYSRFDDVRFENATPLLHTVITDGTTLWIWSPDENAIVEEPLASAPLTTRTILSVHPGFGLDPLAPIPLDTFRVEVAPIASSTLPGRESGAAGDVVVTLTPLDNPDHRATLQLVVDPKRHFVRRIVTLVKESGAMISDARFTDEIEAKPGTWFARRVSTKELMPDGSTVEQQKVYERLRFDVPIDQKKFTFVAPEGSLRVHAVDVKTGSAGVLRPENK